MAKIPTIKGNDIYKKALKAYPPKIQELPSMYGNEKIDSNSYYRSIYQQGYEQAYNDICKIAEEWFESGRMIDYFFMDGGAIYCRSSDAYKDFKKLISE